MGAVSYKGYVATVEFDPAASELVGRVTNAREPLDFRASSAEHVLARFHEIIDGYLAACEAAGVEPQKPYGGKLLLRIPPERHADVAGRASMQRTSINQWIEQAVRAQLAAAAPGARAAP